MIASQTRHLVSRFVGSLNPAAPPPGDDAWAREHLLAGEVEIWTRMSRPDRRHAVAVARATHSMIGDGVDRWVVAAALLHDCGKVESGLGTMARVAATVFWGVADHGLAKTWNTTDVGTVRRRLARYRLHPELGAALLDAAGSHHLTSAWAADHHRPDADWRVPSEIGQVLKACDDD